MDVFFFFRCKLRSVNGWELGVPPWLRKAAHWEQEQAETQVGSDRFLLSRIRGKVGRVEVPEGQAEVEKSRLSLKIDGENVGQIMINHLGYSIFLDEPMLPVKGSSMFFFHPAWTKSEATFEILRGATIHVVALVSGASQRSDCMRWFKRCSCAKTYLETIWDLEWKQSMSIHKPLFVPNLVQRGILRLRTSSQLSTAGTKGRISLLEVSGSCWCQILGHQHSDVSDGQFLLNTTMGCWWRLKALQRQSHLTEIAF